MQSHVVCVPQMSFRPLHQEGAGMGAQEAVKLLMVALGARDAGHPLKYFNFSKRNTVLLEQTQACTYDLL